MACCLVLPVAVGFEVRPALAQEGCPLPAGGDPLPAPPVTAGEVEDGSASLMDFALAAIAQFKRRGSDTLSSEQLAVSGCRLRQEGGPWRSGDTYLVSLTPEDGRVYFHARDMSLSASRLRSDVYAGILAALGVPRAVLGGLASPDADTRRRALAALFGLLRDEPHGPFDLTGSGSGAPAVPGARGYAGAFVSANTGQPRLLLAGFDLDASHVAEEQISHYMPAVTARDVVDRATLREFVTEALRFLAEGQRNARSIAEARIAFAEARLALRDPNGPWRHGAVYLSIVDRVSNVILFHGGFPDRLELRPPGVTRDVVTGELIWDQLLAAATSSPEGGFWTYHFDDPTDDSDAADIPKVGFAVELARTITRSDGTETRTSLIVSSGFYPRASETGAEQLGTVVEAVLPQVMRAMTASTVDAVSGRVQRAMSDAAPVRELSLGGTSTLTQMLMANGQALESGTFDPAALIAASSFSLALDDGGGAGFLGGLTVWGSGNVRNFSGGDPQSVSYDGDVTGASVGIDTRLGADLLAGMSVTRAQGTVDYTASSTLSGELTATVTSVAPYVGWQTPAGIGLWALAGHGRGEVELDGGSAGTDSSDLTQRMAAAGVSGPLVASDDLIAGGTTRLSLKGETAFTKAEVEGSETLDEMTLNASRQRLALEGSHVRRLASGATLTPSVEIGMRHDGGDGETGNGVEVGAGLRFADPATRLTVEARARTLVAHGGDYEEWGLSGLVRIDPGRAGRGIALSLRPAWGQAASGVRQLWNSGVAGGTSPADGAGGRMSARIGYGLDAAPGLGTVTPWAGLGLGDGGAGAWDMGVLWQLAPGASVSLLGTLREAGPGGEPAESLMLHGALRW